MAAKKGCCDRCLIGGARYDGRALDGRPMFRCNRCGHTWTSNRDGGPWAFLVPSWVQAQLMAAEAEEDR